MKSIKILLFFPLSIILINVVLYKYTDKIAFDTKVNKLVVSETDKITSSLSEPKTYRDKNGRFELSYPTTAEISESSLGIQFFATSQIFIDMLPKYYLSFDFGRLTIGGEGYNSSNILSMKKITIANHEAIEILFSLRPDVPVIGDKNKVGLVIDVKGSHKGWPERVDSFYAKFNDMEAAMASTKEIEDIAKSLKYLP